MTLMKTYFLRMCAVGVSASLTYFFYYSLRLYFKKKKYQHLPGPKSSGVLGFYFGNLMDALNHMNKGKMFPIYVQECFAKYGSIFKLQLFDRFIIFTNDPKIIEHGLIEENYPKYSKIYKEVAYPFNVRFLGKGLLTETENNLWRKNRALFQSSFDRKILKRFTNEIDCKVDKLINKLRRMSSENKYINIRNEMFNAVLDIITDITFGIDLDSLDSSCKSQFNGNVNHVMIGMTESFKDPFIKYKPHKRHIVSNFIRATNFLREFGKEMIIKRIKAIENEDYTPHDILSVILSTHAKDDINLDKMVDDFVTLLMAGIETTSNALVLCFMELGRNPDVLNKLFEEIREQIGYRGIITYEDLQNLEYTGWVFKETLRLWPIVPSINRLINEDLEINDFKIPKNTEISYPTYSIHRNPKYYFKPTEFIPERFKVDPLTHKKSIHPYTYLPFSLGPRSCLGQNFALIEAKIIIAKIIQNFEIELEPNQSFDVEYVMNLKSKDGVYCKFNLRKLL